MQKQVKKIEKMLIIGKIASENKFCIKYRRGEICKMKCRFEIAFYEKKLKHGRHKN